MESPDSSPAIHN